MNDNDAFVQAILANPDDDQLRLIYADWLEERGDVRGEFIRVQIELARPDLDPRHQRDLLVREQELLAAHEAEWVGLLRPRMRSCTFRRGFLDEVEMDPRAYQEFAPVLLRAAPVRSFRAVWSGGWHYVADLLRAPHLRHLRRLAFRNWETGPLDERFAEHLAGSPHLTALQELELPPDSISLQGIRALAGTAVLTRLAGVRVSYNDIGDLGAQALLASCHLRNLRRIEIAACGLTNTAVTALAQSDLAGQLEVLDLSHNDKLDNSGVRTLTRCRKLGALRTLGLGGLPINGLAISALAQCKTLAGLAELDLSHVHIGDTGAAALTESPHLGNLSSLNLYKHRGLSAAAKQRLQERFGTRVVL